MAERRMSVREARARFSDILGQVHFTGQPVVVEKNGRPFAALISIEDYEWLKHAEQRDWEIVERVQERNADKTPEDVLNDVTTELEVVRGEAKEKKAS